MGDKLQEHICSTLKDNIAIINGEEYIKVDVFQNVVQEYIMLDAILGSILEDGASIKISNESLIEYISSNKDIDIKYEENHYLIKKI